MKSSLRIIHWIKRILSAINAKKIMLIAIAILLIITPTISALGYIIYNDYFKKNDYFSVTLYDMDNNVIAFEEDNPETAAYGSLVQIFRDISTNPTAIESVNDSKTHIRAVTEWNTVKSDIKCYFSATDAEGYYTDSKGSNFKIPETINKLFIETEYAESFYTNAKIFSLTTIDFDTIVPREVTWNYKTANNKNFISKINKTTEEELTYEVTDAIDIDFEKKPDYEHVCVYDQGKLIYEGNIQDLSALTVSSGNTLKIVIEAEWYKSHNPERYGTVNYDFNVRIKNSSNFSISANTVKSGEFITLSCTNITNISKISFTSDWEDFAPIFARDGKTVKAIIPFKDVESAQEYNFTISYGASKQSFTVKIFPAEKNGKYSDSTLFFDNVSAPQKVTDNIVNEILSYKIASNELLYFQGNFIAVSPEKYNVVYTHNSTMYWGEELEYFYTTVGNEYNVKNPSVKGESVSTIQNGVVSLVSESDNLGRFVVIDHGCGLRTWYTNLSFTEVEQGDILLAGQSVGKTGTVNQKEGFRLYCTAFDTLIDPTILTK